MTAEILLAYEEYCIDCKYEGRVPVSIWAWLDGKQ